MVDETLLPCPACGSDALYLKTLTLPEEHSVECSDPMCEKRTYVGPFATREEAIQAWNEKASKP